MKVTFLAAIVAILGLLAMPALASVDLSPTSAPGNWSVDNSNSTDEIVTEVGSAKTYRITHPGGEGNSGTITVEKKLKGTDDWVEVGDKIGPGEDGDFGLQEGDSLRVNREKGNASGTYEVV